MNIPSIHSTGSRKPLWLAVILFCTILVLLVMVIPAMAQHPLPPANTTDDWPAATPLVQPDSVGAKPVSPTGVNAPAASTWSVDASLLDNSLCVAPTFQCKTIQAAVDAAAAGDTLNIAAGAYVENVRVNKPLTLAGAGQAATTVYPAVSLPNPCTGSSLCGGATSASNIILIETSDVVIHDLTLDGDNTALTSGIVRNGADLDARNGIITNHGLSLVFNGLEVHDVTVKNIYLRGMYASSGGTFNFHHNTVQNVSGDSGSIAIFAWNGPGTMANNTVSYANDAISANHSKGIQFLDNAVTHSGSGVHTDNAGDSGGSADLIQGNTVSDCATDGYGIWVFVPYIAPTVNQNTITDCAVGLSAWGQGAAVTSQFTNNTVDGPASAAGSVGVYITTDLISWGYTDISTLFSGNVITDNETGVYFTADQQLWNPYPYEAKTITANFANNSISGNTNGAGKGTGGAYNLNASGNWWGSNAPATVKTVVNGGDGIDFTPWLDAGTDTNAVPGFQGDFSTLWVDDDSLQTGATGRIQEGVSLVSGSTVNVAAGTYTDDHISITEDLTLQGAGSSTSGSIIDATGSSASGSIVDINVASGNVTVDGFRILTGQNLNAVYAKATSAASTITITNNHIEGWKTSANPGRTCSDDNFDLIAGYGSQASLVFQHNELLQGCSNAILLEKWLGPTDVSYNSWDRGVDDVSTDGYFSMNYGGADISTLQKVSHNTIDMGGGTVFTNNERGTGITFAASYTGVAGGFTNIVVTDNVITNLKPYRRGIGLWNNSASPGDTGGISNAVIERNTITGNGAGDAGSIGVRLLGKVVGASIKNNLISNVENGVRSQAWNSHITAATGVVIMHNSISSTTNAVDWQGADTLAANCNWWGAISGPTHAGNPGGLGGNVTNAATYSPWLVYSTDSSADPGFQLPTSFTVTAGGDISAADNDYRRIANAVGCVLDGQTIDLSGAFNWGATNAVASWALGTDAVASTNDDYEADVPPNADNVTLTAASLGVATIQGPGDVAAVDLEGFLQFYNNGTNQDWTISNLNILDFDLGIGMFCCNGSPSNAYDGATITGNLIRIATDLKGASSSGPEAFQNIGIHLAYGKNQTISNNTIEIPGDGVSDPSTVGQDWWTYGATPGWLYSSNIALQSNTHGGDAYDGLQIIGNTINVLNAQSANPARIIGIWENGHAHNSDMTVANNQFLNLAVGNNPALNRQMAFRVTSHSGGSTTVAYDSNTVDGASMGFGSLDMSAGLQPVQFTANSVANAKTGWLLKANNVAHLSDNSLTNSGAMSGVGVGVDVPASASATLDSVVAPNNISGFATGVQVAGTASLTCNNITGNTSWGVNNTTGSVVNAERNWWGSATGPQHTSNPGGGGDKVSNNVDFVPWALASAPGGCVGGVSGDFLNVNTGIHYSILQDAVDIASTGDTIKPVSAGPFAGTTFLSKDGITIDLNGKTFTGGSPVFVVTADDVTVLNGILDGWTGSANNASSSVLVMGSADNFTLQSVQVKRWADGVEVSGNATSLKIVGNWMHSNTDAGLQINSGVVLGGVVTIEGNLFKINGGNGIQNDSGASLPAEYNSWGDPDGPATGTGGDGISADVDADPFTYAELFMDVDPDAEAVERHVVEATSFDVKLKADAVNLYGMGFKLTYDAARLTLNSTTFAAPWVSRCSALPALPAGTIGYYCNLLAEPEWTVDGGAVATFNFTAATGPSGDGPWTTYLDIASVEAETNASAIGGAKVFVNNAGFNDPSIPDRDITDVDDGRIIIHGLANYTGFVDLQGRSNDSGATLTVYNQQVKAGSVAYASGASAPGGSYTTAHISPYMLFVPTGYWLQVDRPLYLPTTALNISPTSPPVPANWQHSKTLATRPLTNLAKVILLGGDGTDDNTITVLDASCIGASYMSASTCSGGPGANSDVNGDGITNILDLTLMGGNFYKVSSPWTP